MKAICKVALLCLGILFHFTLLSQSTGSTVGNQKVINVPISTDGTQSQALLWLPDDYSANPSKKYPLMIFLHGAGEGGSTISGLTRTGLPQLISQGLKPYGIDPKTGETVKYIVVSPHAANSYWSYQYTHVKNILPFILFNYRADPNRVIISGLSAGGYGTWTCVSDATSDWLKKNITAIVPLSTAEIEEDREAKIGTNAVAGDIAIWAACGTADGHWTGAVRYQSLVQAKGPTKPNELIPMNGIDHNSGAWNPPYTQEFTGFGGKNLWSRMLDYSRSGTTSPPPTSPPPNQAPVANAGNDVTITLPANSVQVNGNGSADPDGSISSYNWSRVSGPTQFSISSSSAVNPTISNLVQGTYVFSLRVTDNAGATATDNISITVNSASTPPPSGTKYVKVNMYGGTSPYNNSEWNNWNAATSLSSGALKYSDGTSSAITATLSQSVAVTDNEAGYTGGMAPAEVLRFTSYTESQRTLVFSGLAASRSYSLEFYASRAVNPGQTTIFSSGSVSSSVPTYNNHDTKGVLSNLVADAQGRITVTIKSGTDYNYLNGFILTDGNGSTPPPSNTPPVANAGPDQNITGSSTTLQGSGSDANGTISSYLWSKVSGPSGGTISSPSQAQTSVTGLVQGTYVFSLRVTDNGGATAADNVSVTVASSSGGTKYIKVNLYGGTNPYSNAEWNNWNIATGTTNLSSGNLKYTNGDASSISATLSQSESVADNGQSYAGGMAPAQVLRYVSYSSSQRTLTISGLVPSRSYRLELYASRAANRNETTIFSAGSASATVTTYNNYNTKGILANLVANSQGRIVVTIRGGRDYNYINGFSLTDGSGTLSPQGSAAEVQETMITSNATMESSAEVFSAYPNPATDQVSLRMQNSSNGQGSIQVIDMAGKVRKIFNFVKNQHFSQTNLSIDDLPKGSYIISVQVGDWRNSVQIMKL